MTGLKKNGERTDRDRIFKTLHFLFVVYSSFERMLFFLRSSRFYSICLNKPFINILNWKNERKKKNSLIGLRMFCNGNASLPIVLLRFILFSGLKYRQAILLYNVLILIG